MHLLEVTVKQKSLLSVANGETKEIAREVFPTNAKGLICFDENGNEKKDDNGNYIPLPYDTIKLSAGNNEGSDFVVASVQSSYVECYVTESGDLIDFVTDEDGQMLWVDSKGNIMKDREMKAEYAKCKTQKARDWYMKTTHLVVPQIDKNGRCLNGKLWYAKQVVYKIGEVIEMRISSAN